MKRDINIDDLVRRYQAGESELALSQAYGIVRSGIRSRLVAAGIRPRGRSESMCVRMAKTTQAERLRLTNAAHAAVRGSKKSPEDLCKRAMLNEISKGKASPLEASLADMIFLGLSAVGLAEEAVPVPQKAVGPYNIDLAYTASRIAVEVFGGNWHATGSHARRFRKRCDYLIDAGWIPVIVWCRHRQFSQGAVNYIVALHQRARVHESFRREEHVLGCAGNHIPRGEYDPNTGAEILSPITRDEATGQYRSATK